MRVGLTGHVKFGMESPKICSTSPRHLLTPHSLSSSGAARIAMSVKTTLALIDPASVPSGVKAAYDQFCK